MTKTNAARLLDTLGVAYEIRTYEVDESDLSAPTVARKVGLPCEQVWKTLVVRGDGTVYLAVVPADAELDLKALAVAAGERKVELAALKDVLPLTGYIRGGVTVLGCRKEYPVFVDDTMELIDRMAVSAGMRGAQLVLNPQDYLRVTKATVARIAR
jgi:Cys-tRNA(Pro)/Cys-tRNA(Cys) deacylase